jgi:hypothetical protein
VRGGRLAGGSVPRLGSDVELLGKVRPGGLLGARDDLCPGLRVALLGELLQLVFAHL